MQWISEKRFIICNAGTWLEQPCSGHSGSDRCRNRTRWIIHRTNYEKHPGRLERTAEAFRFPGTIINRTPAAELISIFMLWKMDDSCFAKHIGIIWWILPNITFPDWKFEGKLFAAIIPNENINSWGGPYRRENKIYMDFGKHTVQAEDVSGCLDGMKYRGCILDRFYSAKEKPEQTIEFSQSR